MRQKRSTSTGLLVWTIQLAFVTAALGYTKSINTPHHYQQHKYWCGAASAQMILECHTIANTAGRRHATYPGGTTTQIQQSLYNDIQAHNNPSTPPPGWATDPDGLQWTLDQYDTVQVYVQYTKSDAAWSCKKLAWTIEHYEVPPAILINDGDHWIVVTGMDTSAAPTPAGTYTINSFTVRDPGYWASALGANKKLSYSDFICYFNPVDVDPSDPWDGLRVSVCDPDPVSPDLIVPPPLVPGPLIGPEEALGAAEAAIVERGLWSEPGFEEALGGAEPAEPVLMHWPFCNVGPCYGVPYVRLDENREYVLTAVIIIHGASGEFMEASYAASESAQALADFYRELTYPFITRESSARPGRATPAPSIMLEPRGAVPIKINFQAADAVVPYGCLADMGDAFDDRGNGYHYGWHAPNYEARDRDAHYDQRYDTLNHMQKPSNLHAVWEIALPNGNYNVVVVCGDPAYQDQVNNLNINMGQWHVADPDPWDGVSDSAGADFDVYEVTAHVSDERLTIEPGEGAQNAKICYVKIVPEDGTVGQMVCPAELIGVDIGESQPEGTIFPSPLCWDITGGGADIWGTADQFYFAYAPDPVSADFTAIVAGKGGQPPFLPHEWAKAGIMIRATLEPGSPHVMIVRTPENGVALQGRDVANLESWHIPIGGGYGPEDMVWLRLDRTANTITGSYAVGGETPPIVWTASSSHRFSDLRDWQILGLATTSHAQGVPITVNYSDLCFGPYLGPPMIAGPTLLDDPAGSDG